MYQSQVRATVAIIVLLGHLIVFGSGMLLGIFGPLQGTDVIQLVLISCPVLGATALAALTYVLANEAAPSVGKKVSSVFSFIVILFPVALLISIFSVFYFVYIQVPHFGPENMKIALGGIESVFGAYVGAISSRLFGTSPSD